jgi:hypothetical protein
LTLTPLRASIFGTPFPAGADFGIADRLKIARLDGQNGFSISVRSGSRQRSAMRDMKSKTLIAVLGIALAIPGVALAQSASQSMHEAGEATENSAASAGHAIVDVYHGTKTATIDTAITAKVKTALDEDAVTKHEDIHVTTVDGVVTLRGKVSAAGVADRATHLAEQTGSVKRVRDKLKITAAN